MRRRRGGSPFLRAAVVGTGAYMAGSSAAKKSAAQAQQEAAQNEQIAELQQQVAQQPAQVAPPPGPQGGQPAAPVSPERDPIALLKQLGELKAAGVLTDEEFEAKKAQLLKQI